MSLIKHLDQMTEFRKVNYSGTTDVVYFGIEDFIRKNGINCTPIKNTSEEFGEIKECYVNAFHLAAENPDYRYVEGVAVITDLFPVLHAWVIDKDNNVIDNTWRKVGEEYFGVIFDTDFVLETVLRKNTYGVIENWEEGFPLLKEKWEG